MATSELRFAKLFTSNRVYHALFEADLHVSMRRYFLFLSLIGDRSSKPGHMKYYISRSYKVMAYVLKIQER